MPIAVMGIIIYQFVLQSKRSTARSQALALYAQQHGYGFAPTPQPLLNTGSYQRGTYENCLWGLLPASKQEFFVTDQTEVRGSGKSETTYNRTITSVKVPDTRIQMVINSQINNDNLSGGDLNVYKSGQRYEAEGNFSKYFDIYMPNGTQVEGLSILAPNTLQFIMQNMADFDIEIVDTQMYLYTYRLLEVAEVDQLIKNAARLVELMRLSSADAVPDSAAAAPIARVAQTATQSQRLIKNWHVAAILPMLFLAMFVQPFGMIVVVVVVVGVAIYTALKSSKQAALRRDYDHMKQQDKQ